MGRKAFHALKRKTGDPPGVARLLLTTLGLECTWKQKRTLDLKGKLQINKPGDSTELTFQCKIPSQLFKIILSHYFPQFKGSVL